MSRKLLGGKETQNKQIILITDGVPTAHIEDNVLHVNYPHPDNIGKMVLVDFIADKKKQFNY